MNNQSPLIPQGSLLEQKNKGRARVKIAVFFVLAIHGIGLLALLVQGCHREEAPPQGEMTSTNPPPAFEATNAPPAADTNAPAAVTQAAPTVVTPEPVAPAVPTVTEYTITKGDTFGAIAKKFHVSVKAITGANPGVEPTKLKVGQKIHIPAAAAPVGAAMENGAAATVVAAVTGGEQVYTVKSGDSLYKIATQYGTTVKALRAANSLKTDKIKVGDKLKIPAKASASVPATPAAPVEAAPANPAPAPSTTPAPASEPAAK